jgi:hypothetical protein
MISFPHSPNDKERDNKNHYANSDGGEPIAVNPISCVRTHAQSDMKEMLKFIGMLGTPVVAPAVMLRAGEDHMMEISTEFAQGYSADRAKQLLAPRPRILYFQRKRSANYRRHKAMILRKSVLTACKF